MMAPAPASQAGPGRDVNDQIMSTACTGRRREGDNFRLLNLRVAQGRRNKANFLSQTTAIQFTTASCGGGAVETFIFHIDLLLFYIIRVGWIYPDLVTAFVLLLDNKEFCLCRRRESIGPAPPFPCSDPRRTRRREKLV